MMQTKQRVIASRIDKIESSITLKLSALASTMKKEGKDVIDFGAGEPDFDTPENIKKAAIQAILEGKNKYTEATGISELKEAICQKLKLENNLDYKKENIVVSCGAKHSLFNAMAVLIEPGDEVIIPTPYWVSYPYQIQVFGGEPIFVTSKEKELFKISPEQLKQSITKKTKAIILNSPSNPTGMVYQKEELEAIAKILIENNIYAISDEIYEYLNYGDIRHISIAELSDKMKDLTIVVNGVSKAYAMTGWRIGYTASSLEIAKAMGKLQSHATSNPTTVAQWASVEAINGPKDQVKIMVKEFDKRRQFMVATLNSIKGISCLLPQGAFYAFPNISAFMGKKTKTGKIINNSLDFCDCLLQETFVSCVPGSGFGLEGYMRLSYATSYLNIKDGLERIKNWALTLQ